MMEARGRSQWDHTAVLLAMLVNINRNPKKSRPAKPMEFNPYRHRRSGGGSRDRVREKAPITILRDIFIDRKDWNRN